MTVCDLLFLAMLLMAGHGLVGAQFTIGSTFIANGTIQIVEEGVPIFGASHIDSVAAKQMSVFRTLSGSYTQTLWVNTTTLEATLFEFYEALGETVCYAFNAGTMSLPFPAQSQQYTVDNRRGIVDGEVLAVYQQNVGRYRRNLYTNVGAPSSQASSFRVILTNMEAMAQTVDKRVFNNTPSDPSVFSIPAACDPSTVIRMRSSPVSAAKFAAALGERRLGSPVLTPELKFNVKDAANPSEEFQLHVAELERAHGRSLLYNPPGLQETLRTLPPAIDNRMFATGVRDQGICGACWAFSSVALTELVANVKGNISGPVGASNRWLSVQNMIDCAVGNLNGTALFASKGCLGGWPLVALLHIVNEGIVAETSYPFDGVNGRVCQQSQSATPSLKPLSAAYYIPYSPSPSSNVPLLMAAIQSNGGVIMIMNANPILYYPGGIFNGPCSPSLGHAVLALGYGTDAATGLDYWIVKNSFGAAWGEGGFFRIAKGLNVCGIEQMGFVAEAA